MVFLFKRWCHDHWMSTRNNNECGPYLTPHTKINSKWIKGLSVRARSKHRSDFRLGNGKLDFIIKIKHLCSKGHHEGSERTTHTERKDLHIVYLIR